MHQLKQCAVMIGLFLLTTLQATAQEKCGTMSKHELLLRKDANYRTLYEQGLESSKNAANSRETSTQGTIYKVPVVIHIMHIGEQIGTGSNISNDQIYSAISSINDAYRKKAGTIYNGNGVDMEIEFCLAQKDPNGNATTGINRVDASATGSYGTQGITDANEINIKALSKWSNTKYYNIWVVSEIDDNDAGSGVQGYAYFAGASANVDGAVMLYNSFGYDPEGTSRNYNLKSYTNKNITCIHELGHAFGLYHTFEGDGSGSTCPSATNGCGSGVGDCCADIPAHMRSQSNCVTGINSCDNTTSRELFIHNYMDYSSDACQNMFTANQYTRARSFLASGSRASLVTTANLIACGCNGNTAPIARFYTLNRQPCEGVPVQFIDESLNAPSSYSWTFTGSSPLTSSSQNPTATYTGSGPYTVSLKVSSSGGQNNTATKTGYITPLAAVNGALPYLESFEGTVFPPTGWDSSSDDGTTSWGTTGAKAWEQRTVLGATGTKAAGIDFYDYGTRGKIDDLISPTYDLTGVTNPSLTFKVAYRLYSTTSADSLAVYVTTNCASNKTRVYYKGGTVLQTTTSATSDFTPTTSADWRTESIDLSAFVGQKVRIVFSAINNFGDNLYLDDINVKGNVTTSVISSTTLENAGIKVYPNPTKDILYIDAENSEFVSAELLDVLSNTAVSKQEKTDGSKLELNLSGKPQGVYLLMIKTSQGNFGTKILKIN